MTCRQCVELLDGFVDGTLEVEYRRQMEVHFGECPPCVTYLKTYQLTIRLAGCLKCKPLPQSLREKLPDLQSQAAQRS
jgi:hypothetical protein